MTTKVTLTLSLLIFLAIVLAGGAALDAAEKLTIKIGGTGGALGTMKELAAAFEQEHPEITVMIIPHLGTRGGISAVLKGAIDIGLAGRRLNSQEIAQGLQTVEYARSPFLFVTRNQREQTNLTYEMIAGIYRGEIRKWPNGTTIRPILRSDGDVDILMLKSISPAMEEALGRAESREGMLIALDDQDNCDLLEKTPGAFGTTTLTQIISEKRNLTILPLNGVLPDCATTAAGRYPHYKPFQLVTGPRSSPLAAQFIAFVTSVPGQAILSRSGNYLPERK